MTMSNKQQTIRNLIIFTLLVNGLAWLGPLLGGDPANPGLGVLIWGTAPLISALVMRFVFRDQVSLGFKPAFKGNGNWYALSIFIYPISIALVLAAGLLPGASTWHNVAISEVISAMLPIAVTAFVFALFEEVGWRGYLTPKVAGLNVGLVGYVFAGFVWASWHFPYLQILWAHTSEEMVTLLPRFILGTIISFIVYGEIRLRTGSVWPAVLMHGIGNTLANILLAGYADSPSIVSLTPGLEWFSSFGVEGMLMMIIFGLIGGLLYRRRFRLPKMQPLESHIS